MTRLHFSDLRSLILIEVEGMNQKKRKQEFNYSGFSRLGLICKDREL